LNNPLKYTDPSGHDVVNPYEIPWNFWLEPGMTEMWQSLKDTYLGTQLLENYNGDTDTLTQTATLLGFTVVTTPGGISLFGTSGVVITALLEILVVPVGIVGTYAVSNSLNQYIANSYSFSDTEKMMIFAAEYGIDPAVAGYYYLSAQDAHRGSKTAGEIISEEKRGEINREFPSELRERTYDEISKAAKSGDRAARKAKKLLDDHRFDK
jgi:hypothetical protein